MKKNMIRRPIDKDKAQPLISGFGNAGAVFGKQDKEETLHAQVIKMARKSGHLNLSNRGMIKIPQKVFHLNEPDPEEQKKMTVNMSMDDTEDRWWEQAELTRLYLSSNSLSSIDPLISNLSALQLLDLSDNRLTTLPEEMKELKGLTKLQLSHNDLRDLPSALCALQDLRVLSLDHNNIAQLPPNIGDLCVLEQMDLSHNAVESLPSSVGYLQRLRKFNLSDNKLKELPPEVGDLFALASFDLTRNELCDLPACLGNLPKLEELRLRQNRLTKLPPLRCPNLKELYLGANRIKSLDEDALEALSGLHVLDLSENGLDQLPDAITVLQMIRRIDLTNNYLSSLPNHMGFLQHLKAMPLEGNPLRLIRRDIVQRGTPQLLKYLSSKITDAPTSFPGFANYVPEEVIREVSSVPDQYEMRNMRAMTYNQKAESVPDELFANGHLAKVRTADLSQNVLKEVPLKLSDLSSHLAELILNHNMLTSLPAFLGDLKHLQMIDVQNNRLSSLPSDISNLHELREINISYNRFESLPSALYPLPSLEILFAGDNRITSLDAERLLPMLRLATLDLRNNSIDFVPPLLGRMTQLNTLLLEGNAFRVPRHDLLAKGTKAVLEYLQFRIVEK